MNSNLEQSVPDSVRKIVEAMIGQAFARCDRLGLSRADFYRTMVEEGERPHKTTLEELIERVFRRMGAGLN